MDLVLTTLAEKHLAGLPRRMLDVLRAALQRLAADPFGSHPQAKPLKGASGTFRLRAGDWRAVYTIDRRRGEAIVEQVLNRRDAYR